MNKTFSRSWQAFTLIELIIAVAMVAIILAMAVPALSNYSLKTIIGNSVSLASSAKTTIIYACQKDPTLSAITSQKVGYRFKPSKHIFDIELGGDCDEPTIKIRLQATGTQPDPVLTITGDFSREYGRMTWFCDTDGPVVLLPDSCQGPGYP